MGATSSKPSANLYDLFNVDIDCTADELKRAYRAKALELHPDRNAHRVDEATALFAKVQAAYDILQTQSERDFYNSQLKNPKSSSYNGKVTSAGEVQKTAAQVLKSQKLNFLQIANYFETLLREEQEAAFSQHAAMPYYLLDAPKFGLPSDPWTQAAKFYAAWTSFSTVKDFSWEDAVNTAGIADRKTRRKFELQNKKLRESAKKEFNCSVKQAVNQLRQLDPRKPAAKPEKPKPASNPSLNSQMHALSLHNTFQEFDIDEPVEEKVECIVCDILFETDFDLQDHTRTSAHKRALAAMKTAMLNEDAVITGQNGKKVGKAKEKAKKKKQAQQILTCATCGQELMSDAFIEHKRVTRH